jgi:hypothetical protein
MRLTILAVAVALVVAAAAPASVTKSGLYGNVSRGPITPVCAAEQSCSAPAANVVLRFTRAGVTTTTRTTSDGNYRVRLTPGAYAVAPAAGGRITPDIIRIRSNHFAHVDLAIDTGIR